MVAIFERMVGAPLLALRTGGLRAERNLYTDMYQAGIAAPPSIESGLNLTLRRACTTDTAGTLRIAEDCDLWLRASRITPILRVPQPLALYRPHAASTKRTAPEQSWQALVVERALQRWGRVGPDGRAARKAGVHDALVRSWREHANAHFVAGDASRARRSGRKAIGYQWSNAAAWKLMVKTLAPRSAQTGAPR